MGVPQGFVTSVTALTEEPWILILLMIGILIAAGCVMETTPNIVILAPILATFGRKHRHERNPVLYHDDHRLWVLASSRRPLD